MPILSLEPAVWPENLFAAERRAGASAAKWWVLHTRPRAEKSLARQLVAQDVSFFLPQREQRKQIRGRSRPSHLPVFPGYVFFFGHEEDRLLALKTNLILHSLHVNDQELLDADLSRVHRLIESGLPLSTVEELAPGSEADIIGGPLSGMRGKVIRRGSASKVFVEVHMLQQSVSAEVDETMIQPVWHG